MAIEILNRINTKDLTSLLINIDNGFVDEEAEINNSYDKLDIYRNQIINILIKRYELNNLDPDIINAYNLYLKFYLR